MPANPSPAPEVLAKLADWRTWAAHVEECGEPDRASDIRSLCDKWEAALMVLAGKDSAIEQLEGKVRELAAPLAAASRGG